MSQPIAKAYLLMNRPWIVTPAVDTMFTSGFTELTEGNVMAAEKQSKKTTEGGETTADGSPGQVLFWDLAMELQAADERVVEGTIMSTPCLRVGKEFLAMNHHKKEGLVVKLPAERVTELINDGAGESFAPAGKVFKEWLAVTDVDEGRWRALLLEGIAFVG